MPEPNLQHLVQLLVKVCTDLRRFAAIVEPAGFPPGTIRLEGDLRAGYVEFWRATSGLADDKLNSILTAIWGEWDGLEERLTLRNVRRAVPSAGGRESEEEARKGPIDERQASVITDEAITRIRTLTGLNSDVGELASCDHRRDGPCPVRHGGMRLTAELSRCALEASETQQCVVHLARLREILHEVVPILNAAMGDPAQAVRLTGDHLERLTDVTRAILEFFKGLTRVGREAHPPADRLKRFIAHRSPMLDRRRIDKFADEVLKMDESLSQLAGRPTQVRLAEALCDPVLYHACWFLWANIDAIGSNLPGVAESRAVNTHEVLKTRFSDVSQSSALPDCFAEVSNLLPHNSGLAPSVWRTD